MVSFLCAWIKSFSRWRATFWACNSETSVCSFAIVSSTVAFHLRYNVNKIKIIVRFEENSYLCFSLLFWTRYACSSCALSSVILQKKYILKWKLQHNLRKSIPLTVWLLFLDPVASRMLAILFPFQSETFIELKTIDLKIPFVRNSNYYCFGSDLKFSV